VFVHIKELAGRMVFNLGYRSGGSVHSHTGHADCPALSDALDLPNSLRLVHDGVELELFINGEQVSAWRQTSYTEGALVLYTHDTTDDGGVDVAFDNILVIED
jgi:hypothetical protein